MDKWKLRDFQSERPRDPSVFSDSEMRQQFCMLAYNVLKKKDPTALKIMFVQLSPIINTQF